MSKRKKYQPILTFQLVDREIALKHAPNGGAIYLLTFPDGKQYVGKAGNLRKRMREHAGYAKLSTQKEHETHQTSMMLATANAGEDNVNVDILEWEISGTDALHSRERAWILRLKTLSPRGFNKSLPPARACLSYLDSNL